MREEPLAAEAGDVRVEHLRPDARPRPCTRGGRRRRTAAGGTPRRSADRSGNGSGQPAIAVTPTAVERRCRRAPRRRGPRRCAPRAAPRRGTGRHPRVHTSGGSVRWVSASMMSCVMRPPYAHSPAFSPDGSASSPSPPGTPTPPARARLVDLVLGMAGEELCCTQHHALEPRHVRADADVHAVPEAQVALDRAVASKRSGSTNSRSSRFAEMSTSTTRCPARIDTPAISASTSSVRPTNCSGSW